MHGIFEDLSLWAKSIFVGLLARGFPAKDDVVNEIIEPALRSRRLGFSSGDVASCYLVVKHGV